MTLEIDLYWSFRSPYSYLATPRLVKLAKTYLLSVRVRPVLPIAVRIDGFFERVNPLWPPYLLRDTLRIAQSLDCPTGPRPDPIVQEFLAQVGGAAVHPPADAARRAAADARRGLHRAGLRLIFGGTAGWNEGTHWPRPPRAGCDCGDGRDGDAREGAADGVIAGEPERPREGRALGRADLVFRGEPFFGQDRIELLVWRLRQHGLVERRA
jgi:2-hydroxychromene-2-carboxylate isomerase